MMRTISFKNQSGAVSLFVVVFATLLITVVTVSFLRLMINDQSQATNNDLSQSAYDSAQAGVEDAKRVLLRYEKICKEGTAQSCKTLGDLISNASCNTALRINNVIGPNDVSGIDEGRDGVNAGDATGEIRIQQTVGDQALDQAYTCVLIKLATDDYIGSVSANESKLIPLVGKNSDGTTDFTTVKVEWFTSEDIGKSSSGEYKVDLTGPTVGRSLLAQDNWPTNRPSILRTQLMQFGNSFTLSSFDTNTPSGQSNTNSIFLYPTAIVSASTTSFTVGDPRKTSSAQDAPADDKATTPLGVQCAASLPAGGYACSMTLTLPTPVGGGNRTAFLRLTPFYNATHFRVTLAKNGIATQFNGVQPEIDSTGRANDLFRRISSRVDLIDTSFPYPDGALELDGNLCKDFAVTDTAYIPSGLSCTP